MEAHSKNQEEVRTIIEDRFAELESRKCRPQTLKVSWGAGNKNRKKWDFEWLCLRILSGR